MVSGEEDVTGYFYEGGSVSFETGRKGNITNHNVYGTNLLLRSDSETEKSHYFLYNAHGDVVRLTQTDTGETTAEYRYDAFGNITYCSGDTDNAVTYAGYQYDAESGLYYVNARYYDSSIGRFITEDTYEGKYTDPLSLNRYTYCHNNPTRYTDPTGHAIFPIIASFAKKFIVGALIGAGMEIINQFVFEDRDKLDWRAVAYEAVVGAVSAVIGSKKADKVLDTAAKTASKVTTKTIAQKAVRTGTENALEGFVVDVGKQMVVDGKKWDEVDYGRALKTSAVSGVTGTIGAANPSKGKARGYSVASKNVSKNADNATKSVNKSITLTQKSTYTLTTKTEVSIHTKSMNEATEIRKHSGDTGIVSTTRTKTQTTVPATNNKYMDMAAKKKAEAQATLKTNAKREKAFQVAQSHKAPYYSGNKAWKRNDRVKINLQFFAGESRSNSRNILNVGAGDSPIPCATNIDINPSAPGVIFGDANDLSQFASGQFDHVIALNPYKYNLLESDVPRVLKEGGIMSVTGNYSNKYFKSVYNESPELLRQAGFDIVFKGDVGSAFLKYGGKVTGGVRQTQGIPLLIILRKVDIQ